MMPDSPAQSGYVTLAISPDPGLRLLLNGLVANETLGRPFLIALELSGGVAKGDLTSLLGSAATVTLTSADNTKRYFNGIVARAAYGGLRAGAYRYRLELRPWIWLLSRTQDCRIFQGQSAWTIITTVFRDAGFSDFQDRRQNEAGETVLDYCVQYRESSLDFVTRLMETFGIYYYELPYSAGQCDPVHVRTDRATRRRRSCLGVVVRAGAAVRLFHLSRL